MPPDLFHIDSRFGDLVRTQRIAGGLTQVELADLAGLSVCGLCDLERGVHTPPQRETVQRLQAALAGTPERQAALPRAARARRQNVAPPRPEPRNLTLTGPGGPGKTRLALSLASDDRVLRHLLAGITHALNCLLWRTPYE